MVTETITIKDRKFTVTFDDDNKPLRITERKKEVMFGVEKVYNHSYWHAGHHNTAGAPERIINAALEQRKKRDGQD